eukprot:TRINITY_DN11706_c0_g1_i2.p1 TRINITY_DN11706_c0_g1~~TRINITY_DN11706_c0_g1_i2.p1  ORF type:complete len:468 (+),score=74.68 TRINITY_DN11706_c0_g1_i2:365-1768(+)
MIGNPQSLNQMYLQVANDLRKAIIRFQKLNIALSEASPTTPSNIISSPPRSPMKKKEQASSESTPHDSLSKESLHFSRPSSQRLDIHAHLIEPYQSGDSPSANFHMRYAAIQSARTAVQSSSCVDVSFFVQLLEQLCDFIQLRRELLSFYSVMANINSFPYDFKVLADAVSAIRERYLNSFRHPLLAVFQTHALCEQTILVDLFKTQDALSRFDYMESIYWNFMTKQELIGWKNTIISLASSPSFVSALAAIGATAMDKSEEKTLLSNHILNWFDFFNHALFSKLSLYFHTNRKKRDDAMPSESRMSVFKSPLDYVEMVSTFVDKSDISCVCLILNTRGVEYHKEGYMCPDPTATYEPPMGIKSYPVVFQYPQDYSVEKHVPNLISLVCQNDPNDVSTSLEPVPFYDRKILTTYYLTPVESRLTLAVISGEGKKRNDKHAIDFIQHISSLLRNSVIFQMLRPSSMRL